MNWFTVKVRYTKQLENGTFKRVLEVYLLPAETFTDAEARIYEEMGAIIKGEFKVSGIKEFNVHDIFHHEECDIWYKCKITFQNDSTSEKKITQTYLVTAESVTDAHDKLKESLKGMMVDFEITDVNISPIVDIFPKIEDSERPVLPFDVNVFNIFKEVEKLADSKNIVAHYFSVDHTISFKEKEVEFLAHDPELNDESTEY